MSADTLRRAAALMRERAEPCDQGPWEQNGRNGVHTPVGRCVATTHSHNDDRRKCEAQHIASWHPAVALAVADWLDWLAPFGDLPQPAFVVEHGLAVARAYLGESA